MALNLQKGTASIYDYVRECENGSSGCPAAIKITDFVGRTMQHNMTVLYGTQGTMQYTMIDLATGNVMINYTAAGDMGSEGSIKYGNYRIQFPQMKEAVAYFGDYTASLVATTIPATATATPLPTSTVSLNPAASASVSSALVAGGQDS